MFRLTGTVETAKIHIVNLPKGSKVSSPDEAHKGQTDFPLTDEQAEIVGFFSTEHKAIFTHHDTYLHMHLITTDRQKMGHLDELLLKKGTVKLYLPMKPYPLLQPSLITDKKTEKGTWAYEQEKSLIHLIIKKKTHLYINSLKPTELELSTTEKEKQKDKLLYWE